MYIVSEDGIEADPEKFSKVKVWPSPKNTEDVQSFSSLTDTIGNSSKLSLKLPDPSFTQW
jgi:hypothetical protein